MNRLYGWRGNPLYHSGVVAAALLGVVLVTGVYLLLFYRIGAPYASVAHITDDVWLGSWTRSLHRYASDAAIAAAVLHAFRMLVQRRSWGPRTLAWVSGVLLFGLIFLCGWTGYVMVWDVQAEVLAREGARWLDALPLFSEPISRAFDGEHAIPGAFFFLNLFAHVALPIGVGVGLWIHVARVARPVLLPPRQLAWALVLVLALAAALLPVAMAPAADVFRVPGRAPYDIFFSFFLPLTRPLAPWMVWLAGGAVMVLLCVVPALTKPRAEVPPPSVVDERSCTGCEQCYLDCPYEAIRMVPRTDGRDHLLAQVDADLCTSCGICAGSCAPMGVGPAGRTGRDQLQAVRLFRAAHPAAAGEVVLVACRSGAGGIGVLDELDGAPVYTVSCSGNLHSSVVEYLVRSGASGVLVASCPPRDCWNREGGRWLEERLFNDREAELQPRVDKRRVRIAWAGERERASLREALARFRADLASLGPAPVEAAPDVGVECEAPVHAMIGEGR